MDDYSKEIDLGREETNIPLTSSDSGSKKGKKRVYYPTLYIENIEGLPALPKEGCMMVKFRRKSMRVEENMDGKDTAGMTLEICRLCLPEDMGEEGEDMASAMAKFAKESGVADAGKEDDDETDDDEGEE